MKKLIALVLSLCLLTGALTAIAETAPAAVNESAAQESNAITITRDELFETARAFVRAGEDAKGFALFEFLADRGDAESQNNLGWMYDEGRGVEKSVENANRYYKMAADQGLDKAQYNLAMNYDFVLKDYPKAMEYYQLAAAQGHAKAINNIGDMYENARGVEQDYARAMEYYQDSLDKGYDYALTSIGYMYENGLGVEPDLAKAVEYYRLAADNGVENGVNHLNRLIEEGKIVKEYRIVQDSSQPDE